MNISLKTIAVAAFAVGILLIIGGGTNLDAGKIATAVCSFIAAAVCMVTSCILAVEARP